MNSSPEELDLPWPRVINSKGNISLDEDNQCGFLQRQLLEQEGVMPDLYGIINLQKYGWRPNPDDL